MKNDRWFFLFLLASCIFASTAHAATVIYYEGQDDTGYALLFAGMTFNLAGHFDPALEIRDINAYQTGDLNDFDHAFYTGLDYTRIIPDAFLDDVSTNEHRVFWTGQNLWQLSEYMGGAGSFGFTGGDYNDGENRSRIDYKDRRMERTGEFSFYEATITGEPTVYSYLTPPAAPDQTKPHFLCGGNLCHLTEIPFYYEGEDDRMLVFADLLHIFYQTSIAESHRAMVRFYDMAPGIADTANLALVAPQLMARDVPVTLAVIPVYKDADTERHFADDPDFTAVLVDLVSQGATLVELGVTHQFDDWTTGDPEFVINDYAIPMPYDSEEWVRDRVEWGLSEFEAAGLTPEFWETPWHMASHGDYYVFADYFDAYLDSPLVLPLLYDIDPIFGEDFWPFVNQAVPYYSPVGTNHLGIVPSNFGCLNPDDLEHNADALIAAAERWSIVRDAVLSFCVYSGIGQDDILGVVDWLLDNDYQFTDPDRLVNGDDDADDDADDDTFDDDSDDDTSIDDDADDDLFDDDVSDDDADDDELGFTNDDDDDDDSGGCGC